MALEGEIPNRALTWASSDEPDWDAVYSEQLPKVYNFFRYRLGNEAVAEDLTSKTFEKAWTARHSYRRDLSAFATWLFTIARNCAVDYLRARRPHAPLEAAAEIAADGTPEECETRASDLARLARLIGGLSSREQELIALKYGAEVTNREIARLTGLTESNVGTILHRAVKVLRDQW